jgi:hypothetical protein
MKRQLILHPRFSVKHAKIVCLILFCVFAGVIFASHYDEPAASATVGSTEPAPSPSTQTVSENRAPEFFRAPYRQVGVGQRITFGLEVIDEESDDVRVELIEKPASARYNERTLTVDWTPRRDEGRVGRFLVRVSDFAPGTNRLLHTAEHRFEIRIARRPVPPPDVPPAPLEVETLVTISDRERLAEANRRWPVVALFQRIAEIEAEKQITEGSNVQPTTGTALFRDMLKNLATLHRNEEINPDSPRFNPQWNAENWRLITVRPRLNKKVFELRLVYRNVVAPEQVYLMPRMRIVRGIDAQMPEEIRQRNNEAFARLLHEAFFDGANLRPFVARDKQRYGAALADFMTRVLTYRDPAEPRLRANFAALPHNARLGGDNTHDAQGRYLRGDGWALGTMKVQPVEREGRRVLAFTNPFIDGFTSSIAPNPAGTAYRPVPAPRFNPASPQFVRGYDALIDRFDGGNIAIPDVHDDGTVTASNIDSTSFARPHKQEWMVAETPLRDPRRRMFEERGMTCIQCHVRNFDEGDYLNRAVSNPQLGANFGTTRDVPRVFFVIVPTRELGRSEYFRRTEEEQVGSLTGVFRDYLGVRVNINSPLTAAGEWPFNTRTGKH